MEKTPFVAMTYRRRREGKTNHKSYLFNVNRIYKVTINENRCIIKIFHDNGKTFKIKTKTEEELHHVLRMFGAWHYYGIDK